MAAASTRLPPSGDATDPTSEKAVRRDHALTDEQVEQLRTQFLRRVAHDIASPSGVCMTVLDELAHADRPRPELVAMAKRSLRRLMRLSEHLSLVAELETGELEPELGTVDVRALVKQAYGEAVSIDGRKDVLPAIDLPESSPPIPGDAKLLLTILREIIGNALKLASSRVEVSLAATDEHVTIRVQDDGPGFAPDSASTLGQRFVKRASARGLGLSLSMGMEILTAHGATLTVESSTLPPGRRGNAGAAVVVTLPRQ